MTKYEFKKEIERLRELYGVRVATGKGAPHQSPNRLSSLYQAYTIILKDLQEEDEATFGLEMDIEPVCAHCGKRQGQKCLDPYERDVKNRSIETILCPECYKESCDSI